MPPLVTLTTDFGLGPYVGVMKGVMAGICPDCRFIDLAHDLPPQNLAAASAVMEWTLDYFPPGTVHLAVVDPGVGTARRGLAVAAGGSFWVGPDNGLFTPVFRKHPRFEAFELACESLFRQPVSNTFHGRDVFAPVAAHLALGLDPSGLGPRVNDPVILPDEAPRREGEHLLGRVAWADHFGNLATNLGRDLVREFLGEGAGEVRFAGLSIPGPLATYSEAEPGQPLALFDSLGRLELAVNRGSMLAMAGLTAGHAAGMRLVLLKSKALRPSR